MELKHVHNIFFLGIGGIGMSALARFFHFQGKAVTGYDKTVTALTRQLEAEGMAISYREEDPFPSGVQLVIFTPAIPRSHPVFAFCEANRIPLMKRAEALGLISNNYECIAVAGTHGKTTTSAILTHLLRTGGLDCSAFLGGIAANYGTNFLHGDSNIVVVEADEYDRSFLHLHPTLLILNALDPDHLDIYGDAEAMKETYYQLIRQIQPGGTLLIRDNLLLPAELVNSKVITIYSFGDGDADIRVKAIQQEQSVTKIDLEWGKLHVDGLEFTLPGINNAMNATAAFAAGIISGVEQDGLRKGLQTFQGVDRRFQVHLDLPGLAYVDDYAHHPAELDGLLQATRSRFPDRKITVIFQPHLFSRTRDFATDFAAVLDKFDEPVVTDIYPARELPIPGIDAHFLLGLMQHPHKRYVPRDRVMDFINAYSFDVLLTAGAGDVDSLSAIIVQDLQNKVAL